MSGFSAYRVYADDQGVKAGWESQSESDLPEGDVLIDVQWSSVNYKDALSASGNKGVTRKYPHTPGIDAAGKVISDSSGRFAVGDEVVVFGFDLGMNTAGGFSDRIRVPSGWVLSLPDGLTARESMVWGTAGYTAALSVEKLVRYGISPDKGPVLVTGASGGVGSVAVMLLSHLGFEVVAASGKSEVSDWLMSFGASKIISREELMMTKGKVMAKPLYQAALDTCGGDVVEAVIPVIAPEGAISTCGMVAGADFKASIFPFILRGVGLLGVDSVEIPAAQKQALIQKLAAEWKLPTLDSLTTEISRDQLPDILSKVLAGGAKGRYLLNLSK